MTDRLFDVPEVTAAEQPELSAGQRRTLRCQEMLANGKHPRTHLALLPADQGHSCGDCAHHFERQMGKKYHKCDHGYTDGESDYDGRPMPARYFVSHGPATDVRVSWPACTGWTPVTDG